MTKTVIYSRQSLDKDKQKNSTDVQKAECLKYAQAKGWLVHEYFDEGDKSARITGIEARPVLQRLLFDAKEGNISRLIVYKRDRLARNVEQYLMILNRLQEADVEIHFAADNEPPIIQGHIGEFVEIILAGLAQQEGENIYRRQTEAKQYLASIGVKVAGSPTFGYTLWKNLSVDEKIMYANSDTEVNEKQIVNRDEATIVKQMYEQFNIHWSRDKNLKNILIEMKEKNSDLANVTTSDLRKWIPRIIHKGWLIQKVGGKTFDYYDENWRIIEEDAWEEANWKLRLTDPKIDDEEKEPYQALLVNKIRCSYCQPLKKDDEESKIFFTKKNSYYRCITCGRSIPIKKFDQFVMEILIRDLKEMAHTRFDSIKRLIEVRFLDNPLKKEKELKKVLLHFEQEIHEQVKNNLDDFEDNNKVADLVDQYKTTHKKLLSIQTSIYRLKTAISEFKNFRFIEELSLETLLYKHQETLLGTLDEIIYSDEESVFEYKDFIVN
ncbi:recombinase family protein [Bacillus sp. EB93]|nr:recombinase family protein [Peribacillus frigoritolerans]